MDIPSFTHTCTHMHTHTHMHMHTHTHAHTYRLQRGYKEPALHEHREPPIGHLVFIVHGIGQNMDVSNINKDTARSAPTMITCMQHVEMYNYNTCDNRE